MIGIDNAFLDVNPRDLTLHKACVTLADNGHDAAEDESPRQRVACRPQILLCPFTENRLGKESRHTRLQLLFGEPKLGREMLCIHIECTEYMERYDITALAEAFDK